MKETIKLCVALGLTCLIAGTVLVLANEKTKGRIEEVELQQKQTALGQVLGDFANQPFEDSASFGEVTFYRARDKDGKVTAVAGEASPVSNKSFGGKMKVLVGLDPDGTVRYVVVTEHKETPGLGTKATERKKSRSLWQALGLSKAKEDGAAKPKPYLDLYTGGVANKMGAADFTVSRGEPKAGDNAVHGVTGATISSRAVKDAVQQVCAAFTANTPALLDQKTEILP